ncbi:SGT1-like protein A [Colletotrichum musicola]|uniref:SGT1-like protein A n=1 Tax=Colletotrichum musicola TaxID=2175873 RepID=A0A8H6MNL0_9PEZI|nr:SGT1-like protein A [Colletotrichum musicola]
MSSDATQGMAALEAKRYDEAILKLSKALRQSPSPVWLIARSRAYVAGPGDFARGLSDAEFAFSAAVRRGNRALMQQAQHRRAVALFRLGRYADADACINWVLRLIDGARTSDPAFLQPEVDENGNVTMTMERLTQELQEADQKTRSGGDIMSAVGAKGSPDRNRATSLRLQILTRLDAVPASERRVSVKFAPDVSIDDFKVEEPTKSNTNEEVTDKGKGDKEEAKNDGDDEYDSDLKKAAAESVRNTKPQQTVRVDFFQSSTTLSVSVFVKNVPKEELKVEYESSEVRLSHIPGHEPCYTVRLWGSIDPSNSKHTVSANKIELQLKKAQAMKWPQLERASDAAPAAPTLTAQSDQPKASAAGAPVYPTSSKTGPKKWEEIGDDEEDERDINAFFKKMYKGATPEQQRAMMKSFTESNGTALSTDWDDVKSRKVQTQPPEGVEAKKWDA